MIATAWAWFMQTPVGKALWWIGAGAVAVVAALATYLWWRGQQRAAGAATAVEDQRRADQKAIDHAETIEDRNRAAGIGAARDGLREYEAKHKR